MVIRNPTFKQFRSSYLFVEIANRRKAFCLANPGVKVISLGVGDTTEPLPTPVVTGLIEKAHALGTPEGYRGYPDYNGSEELRKLICETFYAGLGISPDEIFISDGSKPDLARVQLLLAQSATIAIQDPVYPAYVDGAVISGKSGYYNEEEGRYSRITYMPCTPENGFFPDLSKVNPTDVIFFCSPNNPTGAVATSDQLKSLVTFAKKNKSIIVFDSAYSGFIRDENLPTTIYSIEGAKEVAFESGSFSKLIGFTGVRLGWTVCPRTVCYEDGTPMWNDWSRVMGTCFNGPSVLAEQGGISTLLNENGRLGMKSMISFYLENAAIIKSAMESVGFQCYGGRNSPYVWVQVPGRDSWTVFQEFLEQAHVVITPGIGFGQRGASFIRLSAFAHRSDVEIAVSRIQQAFKCFQQDVSNSRVVEQN